MNEIDLADLSNWWLVCTNGEWFCGTRTNQSKLENLQKATFTLKVQESAKGLRPNVGVMTYPWITRELTIPPGALWLAVEATDMASHLKRVIAATEALKLEARAMAAGVHLVRE